MALTTIHTRHPELFRPLSRARSRSHPGVLLSLVELTRGGRDPLPREERAWATPGGPSTSVGPLDSLWAEGSGTRPARGRPDLAGHPLGLYWPIEPLGRGAQGEVWKAVRVAPCLKLVALKVLRPDLAHRPDRRARFRREAEIAMRLAGPSILPVDGFGEADGALYMIMPLIDGVTLAGAIARREQRTAGGPWWEGLSEADHTEAMARVVAQIARALARAHARRVVHRDVKPANILLDRTSEGRAFLADFGLGRDLDGATSRDRDGSGTPLYMAPEKLLGRDIDEVRCDVYSLGVTLFEALTLVHPTPVPKGLHKSCLATYLAGTEPPRPRALRPSLPPPLEAIILKAMERDPSRRYPHAAGFADDLDAYLTRAPRRRLEGGFLGKCLSHLL